MLAPRISLTAAAVALASLTGCASVPTPSPVAPSARLSAPSVAADEAELDVATGFDSSDAYVMKPTSLGTQVLPAKLVKNFSVRASGLSDALRLLAADAGLELVLDGGKPLTGTQTLHAVSGPLTDVMNTVARTFGLSWHVDGRQLVVAQSSQYLVQLPALLDDAALASAAKTLEQLGASDVVLDRDARLVSLNANTSARSKIDAYLAHLRTTRAMLVYDVELWQVSLSRDNTKGLDWSAFTWTYGAPGSISAVNALGSTSAGAALTYKAGKLDLKAVATWLQTQGQAKSLSRPRLAMLQGGKGSFSVGNSFNYVSKVGSVATNGTTQTTVETAKLDTGLKLTVQGDLQDGTVLSKISLDISDLLRMQKYQALGSDLNLPQTATRQIETTVRALPGDTVLVGGLITASDSVDQALGLLSATESRSNDRSELVMAIRPRIVRFTGAAKPVPAPATAASAPASAASE